jgi:hypothetical protein
MPATRLSARQQQDLAVHDLVQLGSELDEVDIAVAGPHQVSIQFAGHGQGRPIEVIAYEAVSEAQARQLVATTGPGRKVVVANRISEPARKYLVAQGWSWLDRRIGAHLPVGRRDIEIRYPATTRLSETNGPPRGALASPSADGPIRGRAGIAYAAALLCNPRHPPSFRSIASAVNMSPTAISNAASRLGSAGLIGPDNNTPTLPELFWALAEVWAPLKMAAVASTPDPAGRTDATNGTNQQGRPDWVLGGDLAAAELGAPVFNTDSRPWLWVPTQVELRRAERTYGSASWAERAAVLAIPPTPLVSLWRRPPSPGQGTRWPLPHPVFAALELARDPGRGREILALWSPEGIDIVWR